MKTSNILATANRVIRQLWHDKGTIALLFFIPSFITVILYFVLFESRPVFNQFAPMILVMMAFVALFVVASISTLRERKDGTLDRLMTLPIGKLDIILGYAIAFGAMVVVQSLISIFVVFGLFGVETGGSIIQFVILITLSGLSGMSLGLFTSGYAKSEFQAVQFMPAVVFPQMLTSGLIVAREQMVAPLQWFSNITPLTYTIEGAKELLSSGAWSSEFILSLIVLSGFTVLALALGGLTLRRA